MRRRPALLCLVTSVLLLVPVHVDARVIGAYRPTVPQVATFNIYGGNGNAYEGFNDEVAAYGGSNTVQTRTIARGSYQRALGLQEVCQTQYDEIMLELAVAKNAGQIGSQALYIVMRATIMPVFGYGTDDLHAECGSWFGNMTMIRGSGGTDADGWYTAQDGALTNGRARAWQCVRTSFSFCTTHLMNSNVTVAGNQLSEYHAVANFADGANGLQATIVSGDFNLQPDHLGGLWHPGWAFDGWTEADSDYPGESTTDDGRTLDYIFRRPGTWSWDAYVVGHDDSDHDWKVGYLNGS